MLRQKKLQKTSRLPELEQTWIPAPETKTPVQQAAFGNRLGSSLSEKEAFIENIVIGIDTFSWIGMTPWDYQMLPS